MDPGAGAGATNEKVAKARVVEAIDREEERERAVREKLSRPFETG